MTTIQHVNSRPLTSFASLADELQLNPEKNYLFDLSYLTLLRVDGDNGQDYLQGQLSCDVRAVSLTQMRQGAMCNLKGRILALLDVILWEGHGLHLVLPHDLLALTEASLAKTAMFSRVALKPTADYHILGFYLQNNQDELLFSQPLPASRFDVVQNQTYCCYHLGDDFYVFVISKKSVDTVSKYFIKHKQWRGSLAWHALQLQQKHIDIYPESRGLFLPHRLGLHLSGYLSFDKGCYKGQEIIARTHYRATLKHEVRVFTLHTKEALYSGQRLFRTKDLEEVGELIDYCPIGGGDYLVAASVVFDFPSTLLIENHKDMVMIKKCS